MKRHLRARINHPGPARSTPEIAPERVVSARRRRLRPLHIGRSPWHTVPDTSDTPHGTACRGNKEDISTHTRARTPARPHHRRPSSDRSAPSFLRSIFVEHRSVRRDNHCGSRRCDRHDGRAGRACVYFRRSAWVARSSMMAYAGFASRTFPTAWSRVSVSGDRAERVSLTEQTGDHDIPDALRPGTARRLHGRRLPRLDRCRLRKALIEIGVIFNDPHSRRFLRDARLLRLNLHGVD